MNKRNNADISLEERLAKRHIFKASIRPDFPTKEMLVELVNACNHRCIFCAQAKMTRKTREISPELLKRVMREAHELGVEEIGFYSTSEPFMCKSLSSYVRFAKEIGFNYVYITTNGALATEERLKEVIDSGLDSLKFSINAGTRETYVFIHGADDFDKVIERLMFCYRYRESTGKKFRLYVSYIVTRFNQHEIESFRENYSRYCDYIAFCPVFNLGGLVPEIYTDIMPLDAKKPEKRPCHNLFDAIGITCEGYLTACGCADFQSYLIVADLNKTSLYDGWYSEKFTELRKRYIEDNLQGLQCYNCVYGKKEYFRPLSDEYATLIPMEQVFTDKYIKERMSKFPDILR